jgi:hypothetical protein
MAAESVLSSLYKGSAQRAHLHPADTEFDREKQKVAEEMAKQQQQQLCVAFLVVSAMNTVHVDAGRRILLSHPNLKANSNANYMCARIKIHTRNDSVNIRYSAKA